MIPLRLCYFEEKAASENPYKVVMTELNVIWTHFSWNGDVGVGKKFSVWIQESFRD